MDFTGFSQHDFDAFSIEGLDGRMKAIQERIQPKFQQLGTALSEELTMELNKEMFLHIAKHARRKVNPPNDTWLGIADNKRGYKKHPHFQVGMFDDHVFVWLAFIYEMPDKAKAADRFLEQLDMFETLPGEFVISPDHMKKEAYALENLSEEELSTMLQRFRDVKKGELLIGRHYQAGDAVLQDGEAFFNEALSVMRQLIPFYQLSFEKQKQYQ